jgi:hypothetical protein
VSVEHLNEAQALVLSPNTIDDVQSVASQEFLF